MFPVNFPLQCKDDALTRVHLAFADLNMFGPAMPAFAVLSIYGREREQPQTSRISWLWVVWP